MRCLKSGTLQSFVVLTNQSLKNLWLSVRARYFPDRDDIDSYFVGWSARNQRRTLASCNIHRRRIKVARELNHPNFYMWLEPLIYHEMCHAILGDKVEVRRRKRQWHGIEFKTLERRHPRSAALTEWVRTGGFQHAVRSHRSRRTRSY